MPHDFASIDLGTLLDRVAGEDATPGGGSSAALSGALGAALVCMTARATIGKPKYQAHERLMQAVLESAKEARGRLVTLAAEDADAFDGVLAAYRLAQGTDAEKGARETAIDSALRHATQVPLTIMEQCVEVIGIAKNAVECGNRNAAPDCAAGAEAARAGLKMASYSVEANLASLGDEDFRKLARTRMDEMLYMGIKVATNIESYVKDLWTK